MPAPWAGHGTYEAALDLMFCLLHREDELVLLIGSPQPEVERRGTPQRTR
jgi:hypothetical protein